MRSQNLSDLEKITEKIFDITAELAELECDDKIPEVVDEVLKIFAGEKQSARIRCRNGVEIYIEKRRFGLHVETR